MHYALIALGVKEGGERVGLVKALGGGKTL